MKQIVIDTEETRLPKEVYDLLAESEFSPGDQVKIISELEKPDSVVMWVGLILLLAMRSFKMPSGSGFGEQILTDLFAGYSGPEALERELKEVYDVTLTVEYRPAADPEVESWRQFGLQNLNRAYGPDEPDISHLKVLEPNPHYKPWKPGT